MWFWVPHSSTHCCHFYRMLLVHHSLLWGISGGLFMSEWDHPFSILWLKAMSGSLGALGEGTVGVMGTACKRWVQLRAGHPPTLSLKYVWMHLYRTEWKYSRTGMMSGGEGDLYGARTCGKRSEMWRSGGALLWQRSSPAYWAVVFLSAPGDAAGLEERSCWEVCAVVWLAPERQKCG